MYCSRCGTRNDDSNRFCRSCGLDLAATPLEGQGQEVTEFDLVQAQLKDEYQILEELGRGGMAIVFKARERQLERDVAIKVLPFSLAFDKEFVERFQREARTAAKLEHPNIIPIYRVGRAERVIFFVMKFLRGQPLSAVLAAQRSLPPAEIRDILIQVARALSYAHKSGIVHRDIKPDNIMFDEHGLAVVTDFGIAKAATGGKLTGTGMSIGTPHYMSPEQARAQQLDGRSDIYSLGVVAFESLTGNVPFDGEDSFSIGYKHIMEELAAPPLETHEQRSLFEIIRKMMAKAPDDRFQTADELVGALEAGGSGSTVGLAAAPTRAIPSLAGARLTGAPTTPLPPLPAGSRLGAAVAEPAHRTVGAGIALWVVLVSIALGAPGLYAYKKGLLFFARSAAPDSLAAAVRDTLAQRLLSDTGPPLTLSVAPTETAAARVPARSDANRATQAPPPAAQVPAPSDTNPATQASAPAAQVPAPSDTNPATLAPAPVAPGTPGRLTLEGVPRGARVTLNGLPVRGAQVDVPPGTYALAVVARGFARFKRQVIVTPGAPLSVKVDLEPLAANGQRRADPNADPCGVYGPAYNQDNMCFDTKPLPLSATLIPLPADSPTLPRQAILLIRVSRDGVTLDARVFGPSNLETFNDQALDMARQLRWNPAQKNGEPVDAWVQWPFQPVRQ